MKTIMKTIKPTCLYVNGDSWTWGSELGDESPEYRNKVNFAGLLSSNYQLSLTNGSAPGSCNQRILRTSLQDITRLKNNNQNPLVIIAWSNIIRFELFSEVQKKWIDFFPNSRYEKDKRVMDLFYGEYYDEEAQFELFITHITSLQSFLEKNNIPYLMVNVFGNDQAYKATVKNKLYQKMVNLDNYLGIDLMSLTKSYPNIEFGPRNHPLEQGHTIIADFLKTHIDLRYQIEK